MVESRRILEVIHEKSKWIRREEDILKELDEIRDKKKELTKKAKELKIYIEHYKDNIRTERKIELDVGIKGSGDRVR